MGSLAAPEWGGTELQNMSLDLSMPANLDRRIAYERLLLDALHGNQALFVTGEEVEAAWAWIDSISAAWREAGFPNGHIMLHHFACFTLAPVGGSPGFPPFNKGRLAACVLVLGERNKSKTMIIQNRLRVRIYLL
jgi:glucose-6-phosphate 1-dehydrogenase